MKAAPLACPFCGRSNPVEAPPRGDYEAQRRICDTCGRMFLVVYRRGLWGRGRCPRAFPL